MDPKSASKSTKTSQIYVAYLSPVLFVPSFTCPPSFAMIRRAVSWIFACTLRMYAAPKPTAVLRSLTLYTGTVSRTYPGESSCACINANIRLQMEKSCGISSGDLTGRGRGSKWMRRACLIPSLYGSRWLHLRVHAVTNPAPNGASGRLQTVFLCFTS
jgi:hypothetical protein